MSTQPSIAKLFTYSGLALPTLFHSRLQRNLVNYINNATERFRLPRSQATAWECPEGGSASCDRQHFIP